MRKLVWVVVAASLGAGSAQAQVPLDPNAKGSIAQILTWTPQQQTTGYRTIEKIFKTHTVKRGKTVHPLPMAAHQIDPTFTYQGKT